MATRAEFLNPEWYKTHDWKDKETPRRVTQLIEDFFTTERECAIKDYPDKQRCASIVEGINNAENEAFSLKMKHEVSIGLLDEEAMDVDENFVGAGEEKVPELEDDSMSDVDISDQAKTSASEPTATQTSPTDKPENKSAQKETPEPTTTQTSPKASSPQSKRVAFVARKNREKREKLQYKKRKLNKTDKPQRKKIQSYTDDTDGTVYYGIAATQKVSEKRSLNDQPEVGYQCDFYNERDNYSCPTEKTVLNKFHLWKKDRMGKYWLCSEHQRQLVKKAINASTRPLRNRRAAAIRDVENSGRIRAACISLANEVNDLVEDAEKEEEANVKDLDEVFSDMDLDDEGYSAEEDKDPASVASSANKVVTTVPMPRLGGQRNGN